LKRLARLVLGRGRSGAPKPPASGRVTTVVFDFDGTLADTFDLGLEVLNQLAVEFDFRQLKQEELVRAREMTLGQFMRFLGVSPRRLPTIARKGTRRVRERIHEVKPIAGVQEMVRDLKRRGYRLGIITSNSEENVNIFLKNHDMEVFDFVKSSTQLMGKARVIRRSMRLHGFTAEEVLFVGDESRDIQACHEAGIRCAAVSWGFNSRDALASHLPHCLLDAPVELGELLGDLDLEAKYPQK